MKQAIYSIFGACAMALATTSASAQAEGMDYDTLAACSIVYQRISTIYDERGEASKATEFAEASTAYAASALHILGYQYPDPMQAIEYSETRMIEVVESLNENVKSNPDGETGVIEEWLPYCDELGVGVNQALTARSKRGW
jgi:hypothetical protein